MRRLLLAAALLGLLTGCGGNLPAAKVSTASPTTATGTPTTTPTPVPRAPKVGQCHRLTVRAATSPTSRARPVPCDAPHTAVTIYVGRIDPIVDGHLLAIDAKEIQDQISSTCPKKLPDWIGGSEDDQRLSRFTAIWFSPTLAQSDAGADWFRCDVVAVGAQDQLAELPGTAKGALDDPGALDRFGSCGSSAPSEKGFQRVICARPHSWRAVQVIAIPQDATYLGPNATAAGDEACKAEAQQRASDPLVYKWSFEWPAKADFEAGRRYGLCWVPTT